MYRRMMQQRQKQQHHQQEQTVGADDIQQQVHNLTVTDPDLTEESRFVSAKNDTKESVMANDGTNGSVPVAATKTTTDFVPLRMGGSSDGTHMSSEGSTRLMQDEVSLADLERMTSLFYDKAFQDKTLDPFIRSHDDPHAARFAKWIHQKLSATSTVWDDDRRQRSQEPVRVAGGHPHVVHDRSSAHVAAWYSPKRPSHQVGRHFKLDECRVWMRLHFWALREAGLLETAPNFSDYYVRFIGHFVKVYESTAPVFARESLRWSANSDNLQRYLEQGRRMNDVLGLSVDEALAQLPAHEAQDDSKWPYNQTPVRSI